MKKFVSAVDRFCYRHPRFGIPNLMLYVVIANALIWLFSMMDTTGTLAMTLMFSPYHILRGQVWRIFSFALMPHTSGFLALIAFYFYYFIGSTIERQWGSGKFTVYFLSGLLLTVIYGFIVYFILGRGQDASYREAVSLMIGSLVSAYYIYLSMFFTFATLYPDTQVLLFFFIPIKMKWLGILDAALFLYEVIRIEPFIFKFLPIVAVLNYLLFCGEWLFAYFRPAARQQRHRTVNFQNEVRRMRYEQQQKPYNRICEVCGRTDTDYPELEFRYCSRCAGYHCFCIEHINNHRHFRE
ncbi:MAG: hypothetical protein IJ617_00610 [Oscillospiraceae bacterium]|nr:hypothetical protein [Oscillospiraceae bacterium]